ncbi:hypothetical protein [Desulfotomaculum copahuensis]|uniref:hypothetical protein n=1 Tax=Desulfotomaculum copahuensis TaxID=1838280 RepID=UPI000A5BFDD0|nr:hypothetical protein [Desulfotomaculum copahuensis]
MGRARHTDLGRAARLVGGTAAALLGRNAGVKALGAGLALSELLRGNLRGLRRKRFH